MDSLGLVLNLLSVIFIFSAVPWVFTSPSHHVHVPVKLSIWLEGGDAHGTGNVIISLNGTSGAICDDGWTLDNADVVCKMLGFPYALGHTRGAYFGRPDRDIVLDDVQCYGTEENVLECRHREWGGHDCDSREAAGVFCAPKHMARPTTTTTTTTTTIKPIRTTRPNKATLIRNKLQQVMSDGASPGEHQRILHIHSPDKYEMRLTNGRNPTEGRVEVRWGNQWGVICADSWSLLETTVVCKSLGLGFGQMAVQQANSFGGEVLQKVFSGIRCDGQESHLSECFHEHVGKDVKCPETQLVAGVVCSKVLPDLVPNATLLEQSTYLQDRPLLYLQCALEENCAASGAYEIMKKQQYDWPHHRRRLLRFSSSTWNFGTADFRPNVPKNHWEWHMCHMHYHSMSVFAHYDLIDLKGNEVAEGHKASFCLEDVQCMSGVEKKYVCKGFGDQGISVGCADDYLHDIDCQWIDITEVKPGNYIFQVHINPEFKVAELDYENNIASCKLEYTGFQVFVTDCTIGER